MNTATSDRAFILFFRLTMGWTFLYAASHQVFVPGWSVAGFLSHTTTFNWLFGPMASPEIAPALSFLVSYGHLFIGLSLLVGLMVRVSAALGALMMLLYWMAHMDFPYISDTNNFIIDSHIVYAGALVFLIAKHAGHVWGLDGWLESSGFTERHPGLKPLFA